MLITPAYAQARRWRCRQHVDLAAAVRADLRHHVLPDDPAAAEEGEGAPGDGRRTCGAATPWSPRAGLVGKVTKVVDDDQIEFEIADGVRVRQMRQMIRVFAPRASRQGRRRRGELTATTQGRTPTGDFLDGRVRPCSTSRDGRRCSILLRRSIVCAFAIPNFVSPDRGEDNGRIGRSATSVLGLDLQGGSHILLQVDPQRRDEPAARGPWRDVLKAAATSRSPGRPRR